ncbi:hypothetical protein [Vibrio ishigakensis]|nr:hypothetical protein [Vibrio ishigakensis]
MKLKHLSPLLLSFPIVCIAGGGHLVDERSKIAFDYDTVSSEVAQNELVECQQLATSTQSNVQDTTKGSGARGAAKGAAKGATVMAIAGESGSDGAKVGAAVGVVKGRRDSKKATQQAMANNEQQYATVLRNCMVDKKYVALN